MSKPETNKKKLKLKVKLRIPDESFVECPKNRALVQLSFCMQECEFYKGAIHRGIESACARFENNYKVSCAFPINRNILVNRPIDDQPSMQVSDDDKDNKSKFVITD